MCLEKGRVEFILSGDQFLECLFLFLKIDVEFFTVTITFLIKIVLKRRLSIRSVEIMTSNYANKI